MSAWKLSDVTMVKTTNNIYLLALCYFHSLKDERIHAYNSMRPSSEPTADPEPEPSADLQWLNARMPIYIPWLAILICGISSSKVCDWEKQICRIIDHAPRSKHTILYHLISDSLALMMMLWLNRQVVLLMSGSSSSVSEEFTIFAIFRSPSCSIDDLDLYDSEINDTITGSFTNALSDYNKLKVFDLGECYLSKLKGNKYQASTESRKCDMECLSLESNNIESMRLPTKADHKSWT